MQNCDLPPREKGRQTWPLQQTQFGVREFPRRRCRLASVLTQTCAYPRRRLCSRIAPLIHERVEECETTTRVFRDGMEKSLTHTTGKGCSLPTLVTNAETGALSASRLRFYQTRSLDVLLGRGERLEGLLRAGSALEKNTKKTRHTFRVSDPEPIPQTKVQGGGDGRAKNFLSRTDSFNFNYTTSITHIYLVPIQL